MTFCNKVSEPIIASSPWDSTLVRKMTFCHGGSPTQKKEGRSPPPCSFSTTYGSTVSPWGEDPGHSVAGILLDQGGLLSGNLIQVLVALGHTDGNQGNLPVAAEFDLVLVAGIQAHLSSVGLAHHQIAVELDPGDVAQGTTRAATTRGLDTEGDTLGLQQCLIEGSEVEAFGAILLGADVAGGANQVGFGHVPQLLDQLKEIGARQFDGGVSLSGGDGGGGGNLGGLGGGGCGGGRSGHDG